MCWTKDQLEILKQIEAEEESQIEEKEKTKLFFSFYGDDLL